MDVRNKETRPSSGSLFFLALQSCAEKCQDSILSCHGQKCPDSILSCHGQTGWPHSCGLPREEAPCFKVGVMHLFLSLVPGTAKKGEGAM